MVLETSTCPQLKVVTKLRIPFSLATNSVHLVDNSGKLMLVHRQYQSSYDVYHLVLEKKALLPVKGFNGRALFLGERFSFSICTRVFPFIKGSTIYLSFDYYERIQGKFEAYYVPRRRTRATKNTVWDNSLNWPRRILPSPHSVVDCLSLCNTRAANSICGATIT